jgi:hypothetical protein
MKRAGLIAATLFAIPAMAQQPAQEIHFEVRFSKPLAVLQFVQSLGIRGQPKNPFRVLFDSSEFNNAKYSAMIAAFDSIPLGYEYEFSRYPGGDKVEGSTLYTLRRNLILSKDLDEFRNLSIGVIPLADLVRITAILKEFTPVYDKVIYEPVRPTFEKQLKSIDSLVVARNIAQYFTQASSFYRATWDSSIPFWFVFYPQPIARGFSATAFANISMSALPTSYTEFTGILTVMLHESSHILFDEESVAFKTELSQWVTSNPSKYSHAAYALVNEAWATAVGNGYFREKLTGSLNPGSWYNFKYNDQMAKAMYPFIKEYLDQGKPMDKALVDKQVEIYETKFPHWLYEWENLLQGRTVISEDSADFDLIDRKFPYNHQFLYLHDFSSESFEKLERGGTKFVIIHRDNKRKLDLVKKYFPALARWKPDPKSDFSQAHMMPDKTQLIIVNLVTTTLEQQLSSPISPSAN